MPDSTTTAPTITLERDLDAWVEREISNGTQTPAFWNGCNTSERLAHYLVALGYVKVGPCARQTAKMPPPPHQLMGALQDRPKIKSKARVARTYKANEQ